MSGILRIISCYLHVAVFILLYRFQCFYSLTIRRYEMRNNTFIHHGFLSNNAISALQCCAQCSEHPHCRSVSYMPDNQMCQLNNRNPALDIYTLSTDNSTWRSFVSNIGPCTTGWTHYNISCYLPVSLTNSWEDSLTHCQTLGARLVDIFDPIENVFVSMLGDGTFGSSIVWIGLNDKSNESSFVWSSGAPMTFSAFESSQPNGGTGENCVSMYLGDANWHDCDCTNEYKSICKKDHY